MRRVWILLIGVAVVSVTLLGQTPSASLDRHAAQPKSSDTTYSSKRMADGKQWTTQNLNVNTAQSYCYEDAELNCRQYGRLYTWEAARRGCQSLGDGWRLPTDDEWRQMAKHYGGLLEDSADGAKATYRALVIGGTSGFSAMLGGSRISEAGMNGWKLMASTGRPRTTVRPVRLSITLVKAVKLSVDTGRARSRWQFPFGVSRSETELDPTSPEIIDHVERPTENRLITRPAAGLRCPVRPLTTRVGTDPPSFRGFPTCLARGDHRVMQRAAVESRLHE